MWINNLKPHIVPTYGINIASDYISAGQGCLDLQESMWRINVQTQDKKRRNNCIPDIGADKKRNPDMGVSFLLSCRRNSNK